MRAANYKILKYDITMKIFSIIPFIYFLYLGDRKKKLY